MSIQKVNHNVWHPWTGADGALTAAGGAADNLTSDWWDVNGWTDKRVSWEVDSAGTIDFDMEIHISPQGYYELNAKTCTTDDYEVVAIVTAHTAAILASVDADDGQLSGTGNWSNLTNDYFGIIVLEDADGSCTQTNPVINRGDKVVITVRCSATRLFNAEIPERTDLYGQVIPEVGSWGIISFTTPASYNDVVYDLQ